MSIYIKKNGEKQKLKMPATDIQVLDMADKFENKDLESVINHISDTEHIHIGEVDVSKDGIWVDNTNLDNTENNGVVERLKGFVNGITGKLSALTTDSKTSIVDAINEHEVQINDNTTQLADTTKQLKNILIDVKNYGAIGDWNGVKGTDNLIAFNNAVNALPTTGGEILISDGDFWLSDSWNIDKDNVAIKIMPSATIRTTTPTTKGHTIGFIGYDELSTQTTPQRVNAKIYGGGYVENISNGTNENAIGCTRYNGFTCIGINIPMSNRKAITCQYGVDNILISSNHIGIANYMGISIETKCKNIVIENNIIDSTTTWNAINISSANSVKDVENVSIRNNIIYNSTGHSIYADYCTMFETFNNKIYSGLKTGIFISNCDIVNLINDKIFNCNETGISLSTIEQYFCIDSSYLENPSNNNKGIYEAIVIKDCAIPFTVSNNTLKGANHKYAINIYTSNGNAGVFKLNTFDKGISDVDYQYQGWTPLTIDDILDGVQLRVNNRSNKTTFGTTPPKSSTWTVGDIVINTNPITGSYLGFVCTTGGTPGTWKGYGQIGIIKGTTTQRPQSTVIYEGYVYLDTTLIATNGKPIIWNGANWIDYTGTIV